MNKFLEARRDGKVLFISHRGAWGPRPENTMAGFRYALEIGADGLETDLHGTKDGRIVIMHDETVATTTNGTGLIREMTFDEVTSLDAGERYSAEYAGEKVPSFDQLLELTAPVKDFLLMLELKDYPELIGDVAYKTCDTIVRMCDEYGVSDRVMFLSLSTQLLLYLSDKYGDRFAYAAAYPTTIMKGFDEEVYRRCAYVTQINVKKNPGPNSGHDWSWAKDHPIMEREKLDIIRSYGAEPMISMVVDTKERIQKCLDEGMHIFTCNNPQISIEYFRELGLK